MMRVTIDKKGFMVVHRTGRVRGQFCPITPHKYNCGDWCPMFLDDRRDGPEGQQVVSIHCGGSKVEYEVLEDLREKPEEAGNA